ncbi:Metallo-dependent hydrolase [Penicillium malachiteum]|nr:Metallo-dependent hydrolase [Penicillium malachiteum]
MISDKGMRLPAYLIGSDVAPTSVHFTFHLTKFNSRYELIARYGSSSTSHQQLYESPAKSRGTPALTFKFLSHGFFQVFSKLIYQLCDDLESLAYATNSVLEDFLNDGVRYLELRTIPRTSPSSKITQEEYLNTVLDTISAFKSNPQNKDLSVFLILSLDRGNTTPTQANEIIDLAITNNHRGVFGVDLCGNPTQGDVSIYWNAFAYAKSYGLGLTLHFAETPTSGTREELQTLLSFSPDRPVSNEYLLAAEHFGVDRAGLVKMCRKSIDMIFGGELEKERFRRILREFEVEGSMDH